MILNLYLNEDRTVFKSITQNLQCRQHEKNLLDCFLYDFNSNNITLDGATVLFTVKENITDSDLSAKISKTITNFSGLRAGEFLVELTKGDTEHLAESYFYSIVIIFSDGKRNNLAEGIICFRREISSRNT